MDGAILVAGAQMMRNGTPVPVIAEIPGHNNLHSLVRCLQTGLEQIEKAVNGLKFPARFLIGKDFSQVILCVYTVIN